MEDKTPVLSEDGSKELLGPIDTNAQIGLRYRAHIGMMLYAFGRVEAVSGGY